MRARWRSINISDRSLITRCRRRTISGSGSESSMSFACSICAFSFRRRRKILVALLSCLETDHSAITQLKLLPVGCCSLVIGEVKVDSKADSEADSDVDSRSILRPILGRESAQITNGSESVRIGVATPEQELHQNRSRIALTLTHSRPIGSYNL